MKSKVEFKVYQEQLPDLFTFCDGRAVTSKDEWVARREEIKQILQDTCFGTLPPAPQENPCVIPQAIESGCIVKVASRNHVRHFRFTTRPFADSDFDITFDLYRPMNEVSRETPLPVIMCGDACWNRVTPEYVDLVTGRGYMLCVFDRCRSMPDFMVDDSIGVLEPSNYPSFLQRRYPELNFGALMAWTWTVLRVRDALEQIPWVDNHRVAVCGHSRGGKVSLLAGAFDERFAVVCTNGSGSGGSGSWLYQAAGTEPMVEMRNRFPTWYGKGFSQYDSEADLPFDAHFIKALCAPRPLLISDGLDDLWANPAGSAITQAAVREVYRFLGCPDSYAGSHFRNGPHGHRIPDWTAMLDYCDTIYKGEALPWDSLYCPYADLPTPFKVHP